MNTETVNAPAVDQQRLVRLLLDEPWHAQCEIIPDYMPPHPQPDTRPRVVVRHNNGTEYPAFLRYSCGPKQGFFWDIYGDDMQEVELAIIALSQAPAPRSVAPMVFKLPLRQPTIPILPPTANDMSTKSEIETPLPVGSDALVLPSLGELLGNWYECAPYGEQVPTELPRLITELLREHAGYEMDEDRAWEIITEATPDDSWLKIFECIFAEGARYAMHTLENRGLLRGNK